MWKHGFALSSLVAIVVFMAACARQSAPPPPVTTAAAPVATQAPSPEPTVAAPTPVATAPSPKPATPTVSPEGAAWAKVAAAAKNEGKVTVLSITWTGEYGIAISKAFKDRYGIIVNIITGRGPELTERLKTERRVGQQTSDMLEVSPPMVATMLKEGLLASTGDILPALRQKGVWLVDPTTYDPEAKRVLVWQVLEKSPYINTNLVKPEEVPRSWKDLLQANWKGKKMSWSDPRLNEGPYLTMAPMLNHKIWDEDYIKALYKQDLVFGTSSPNEFDRLSRGEVRLSVSLPDNWAGRYVSQEAPIRAVDMSQGTLTSPSTLLGAVSGGPHPNAALLLLNWLLEPEGETVFGKATATKMVRTDVPDFRPLAIRVKQSMFLVTPEDLQAASRLFNERWFDKLVGR